MKIKNPDDLPTRGKMNVKSATSKSETNCNHYCNEEYSTQRPHYGKRIKPKKRGKK